MTKFFTHKIFSLIFILPLFSLAQIKYEAEANEKITPVIKEIIHPLGDNRITIQTFQYGDRKDIVFINLHDNESTAVNATQKLLESAGGMLIKIDNGSKRNISFRVNGRSFIFDPNRIFSKKGIQLSLLRFGNSDNKAIQEIDVFAKKILELIPQNVQCIIALHNNSNDNFSIKNYLPGKENATDTKEINIDTRQDADDFFLTTDSLLFQQLKTKNYNVVLQDNLKAKQDGSLSVYFGEKNKRYLNCETEHGKSKQYEEMLKIAIQSLQEIKMN